MQASPDEKKHVFRDPIHGFIAVEAWEKRIIDTPCFQRLKRIHQLALTHYIFHGAEHTRFGHSLGVMHIASRILDHLRDTGQLCLAPDAFRRLKYTVRLAALLHDVGHGCFSHVGEDALYPFPHEEYARRIIRQELAPIIDDPAYQEATGGVTSSGVIEVLSAGTPNYALRFVDDIISGQLDADKMDYLLRDSYYCGVEYGQYDLDRLIHSLAIGHVHGTAVLSVREGGIPAVEEFVLARYWMFIQVYFHKYRRMYDHYLTAFIRELLAVEHGWARYPEDIAAYLGFDDALLQTKIRAYALTEQPGPATERLCAYARRLYFRRHLKCIYNPPFVHYNPEAQDNDDYGRIAYLKARLDEALAGCGEDSFFIDHAKGSTCKRQFSFTTYSPEAPDPACESAEDPPAIPVIMGGDPSRLRPIQDFSHLLKSISDINISILRVYSDEAEGEALKSRITAWLAAYKPFRNSL